MSQNVFKLAAMTIDETTISQISEQSVNTGLQEVVQAADDAVDPTYAALMHGDPVLSFTTSQIAAFLAAVGISGKEISSSVNMYFTKTAEQGINATAGQSIQVAVSKGLILPRRIQAAQGSVARIMFDVIAVSTDGLTNPLAATTGGTSPSSGVSQLYTAGPLKLNGTDDEGVQSMDFDFGLTGKPLRHSGLVYPVRTHIESRRPSFRFTTTNALALTTLGAGGTAQGSTDSVAWLRKLDRLGARVANNASEHISFTLDDGVWRVNSLGGSFPSEAAAEIEWVPAYDGSNAIVVISTGAAIT